MATEIKRNNWARFLRRFNADNQYRSTSISITSKRQQTVEPDRMPFLGLALTKSGRMIDGISLFTGQPDPEQLAQPTVAVNQPVKVMQEKNDDGTTSWVSVASDDGSILTVTFDGEPEQHDAVVGRLAYAMYEHRGADHGHDEDDWHQAEQAVLAVTEQLAD